MPGLKTRLEPRGFLPRHRERVPPPRNCGSCWFDPVWSLLEKTTLRVSGSARHLKLECFVVTIMARTEMNVQKFIRQRGLDPVKFFLTFPTGGAALLNDSSLKTSQGIRDVTRLRAFVSIPNSQPLGGQVLSDQSMLKLFSNLQLRIAGSVRRRIEIQKHPIFNENCSDLGVLRRRSHRSATPKALVDQPEDPATGPISLVRQSWGNMNVKTKFPNISSKSQLFLRGKPSLLKGND